MSVDNFDLVASFIDEAYDGDTFWYTEILDRSKRSAGDNRKRLLRMYHHKTRQSLLDVKDSIVALCETTGARAYTRLSPRSAEAVGKHLAQATVEAAMAEQWDTMPYLYARACGRTSIHGRKLWLYDVDEVNEKSHLFAEYLWGAGYLVKEVPSRKGVHFICKPHNPQNDHELLMELGVDITCHKDNPTNLYIPDSAG